MPTCDSLQTILFTTDDAILEAVSLHDTAFEADALMDLEDEEEEMERPVTADKETEVRTSLPPTSSSSIMHAGIT